MSARVGNFFNNLGVVQALYLAMRNIVCLILFSTALRASGQTTLYTSSYGKGTKCSKEHPCSLYAAKEQVRRMVSSMSGDIVVILTGGTYFLDSPLEFGPDDGGKNGYQVIYTTYDGGQSAISGGLPITGWSAVGNGIYQAKYEGPGFRQLYVNGKRATRARSPNRSDDQGFGPYYRYNGLDTQAKRIRIDRKEIVNLERLGNLETVIKHHWDQGRYRIDSMEEQGDQIWINFKEPETSIDQWQQGCCPGWSVGQSFYFEGSFELLDAPGEWFLDETLGLVYYYPRPDEKIENIHVIAPTRDVLLAIDGASYLTFKGLVFECTNWDMPNEARIGVQSGWRRNYERPFIPGGIQLANAHHIQFTNNIIRFFGGTGIEFAHSSHDNVIEGNLLIDIASNGIQIYTDILNSLPDSIHECRNDSIVNNYITRVAQDYTGGAGINVTFSNGIVIENNEVFDLPYTGISIGWGWTDNTTNLKNNLVRYNNIHHVMQLHDDGGGIYSLSNSPNTIYSHNYIHHIVKSQWAEEWPIAGIYLDNGSSGILVEYNVVDAPRAFSAWNEPNHGNTIRHNWHFPENQIVVRPENKLEDNFSISSDTWPRSALDIQTKVGPNFPMPVVDESSLLTPIRNNRHSSKRKKNGKIAN